MKLYINNTVTHKLVVRYNVKFIIVFKKEIKFNTTRLT